MFPSTEVRWLLLIHQIPPKPGYLRVKVWRRLHSLGSVAIKNSVYVLPRGEQTREDLEWVLREITEGGGDASICEARFIDGLDDDQIEGLFHAARDADYAQIVDEAHSLEGSGSGSGAGGAAPSEAAVARLRSRLQEVMAIDFFDTPGRLSAAAAISEIEQRLRRGADPEDANRTRPGLDRTAYRGRTWVTRQGVFVDRIASAWLIRREIDPDAIFRFVPARGYSPRPGELRFDMFDGEFAHVGDRCTFEVLLEAFQIDDPALSGIAEIIHDIDLKDAKFGRLEAAGIATLLTGIASAYREDEARLARGFAVFDDLRIFFARPAAQRPLKRGEVKDGSP